MLSVSTTGLRTHQRARDELILWNPRGYARTHTAARIRTAFSKRARDFLGSAGLDIDKVVSIARSSIGRQSSDIRISVDERARSSRAACSEAISDRGSPES